MKSEGVTQKHNYIISPGLVACWFIAVLTVWILAAGIAEFFPLANDSNVPRSAIEILSSWDGEHYTEIASNGYSIDGADRRRFAFFPLLPTVAGLLGGQSHAALAGILFSQICYLGCIILLNNIVLGKKPTPLHLQPGFWLLVSPLSFFFLVFYTESLFLFLTLLMVSACRKECFKLAFVLGILLGLTRPTAICLPIVFLWWAVQNFRQRKNYTGLLICAPAPLLGVIIYVGLVGYLVGEPFAYLHIQREWWDSHWAIPFVALLRDLKWFFSGLFHMRIPPIDVLIRLFSSISILTLIVWGWRKCDLALWVFLIVSMLFIHSQEPHRSTARYELLLFPIYFLIPQTMSRHPRLAQIVSAALAIIQILIFIRYSSKLWVA